MTSLFEKETKPFAKDFSQILQFRDIEKSYHARKSYRIAKRALDLFISIILVLAFSPLLIFSAILIKLTSRGPAIFTQPRAGLGGRLFIIYKFRTLKHSPHFDRPGLNGNLTRKLVSDENDPRITKIGRILRKTSIDELPQLFNVILGDMSLVGPRPLVPFMLEPHEFESNARAIVRPGITGLWQVNDRGKKHDLKKMARFDIEYIENFSFWQDLRIMLKTIGVVLSGKGAI